MKSRIFLLSTVFVVPLAHAAPQFNFAFIHGGHSANVDKILTSMSTSAFPEGQYALDIYVNNQYVGHNLLTVTSDEKDQLKLTPSWLKQTGLSQWINLKLYKDYFDAKGRYYLLTKQPDTHIKLDVQKQVLLLTIPQFALLDNHENITWNEGDTGFLLQYYMNAFKSPEEKTQFYGNGNFSFNYRAWRLMGNAAVDEEHAKLPSVYLKRDIQSMKSDVVLGKTATQTEYYSSFPFIGAALYSNEDMTPWSERGYAPIISGVASSGATITISQAGYVLKQLHVPAGPYSIRNLDAINNGAIKVRIHYDNGQVVVRYYSVNTLPTLLRPSLSHYYVAGGIRDEVGDHHSLPFVVGEYAYGFAPVTLMTGGIVSKHYANVLFGATKSLGWFGAVSLQAKSSFFDLANLGHSRRYHGENFELNYTKSFGNNTSVQASANQYSNENYASFASFDPNVWQGNDQRYKYTLDVYQNVGFLNSSFQGELWHSDNFDHTSSTGANVYWNASYGEANFSVNAGYEKNSLSSDHNLMFGLSCTFPFGHGAHAVHANLGMNGSSAGGSHSTSYTAGISQSPTDRFNYSASTSLYGDQHASSLYGSYNFNGALLSGSVYQDVDGDLSYSAQLSGSVVGVHDKQGKNHLVFTRNIGDTVAVVDIPHLPNIQFSGSTPTDSSGLTVSDLSGYQRNLLSIDTANVPNNVTLLDTTYNVMPSQGAIIYKKFNYVENNTYILQLLAKNGFVVPFGTRVTTPSGEPVGYTQNHGILIARVDNRVTTLIVDANTPFKIDLEKYKKNITSIQEVKNV